MNPEFEVGLLLRFRISWTHYFGLNFTIRGFTVYDHYFSNHIRQLQCCSPNFWNNALMKLKNIPGFRELWGHHQMEIRTHPLLRSWITFGWTTFLLRVPELGDLGIPSYPFFSWKERKRIELKNEQKWKITAAKYARLKIKVDKFKRGGMCRRVRRWGGNRWW